MEVYAPTVAKGFSIDSTANAYIIRVTTPWEGGDSICSSFSVPTGGVKRIAVTSTSHVGFLDAINYAGHIVAASGTRFIVSDNVKADKVAEIGYDSSLDYEALIAAKPDVVILYGVNSPSPLEGKLKELGIPYLYFGEQAENHPLGKAEWLIAAGYLTGNQEAAKAFYQDVSKRYNTLKDTPVANRRTKVMMNMPYQGTWFMPSNQSYIVHLIKDAGGECVYNRNTGSASSAVDIEEAYTLASEADIWINPGAATSVRDVATLCPRFTTLPLFQNIYNNNKRVSKGGGNDYYESGIVRPDLVLKDLRNLFNGTTADSSFTYYQKLK